MTNIAFLHMFLTIVKDCLLLLSCCLQYRNYVHFTARKRCFCTCLSVILFKVGRVVSQYALQVVSQHALQVSRGRGCVSQLALQVSRPTPGKGLRALAGGGGSPGPHPGGRLRGLARVRVSRPTPRGVYPSMHWGRPPSPSWWLLLRVVCILLECILVVGKFEVNKIGY